MFEFLKIYLYIWECAKLWVEIPLLAFILLNLIITNNNSGFSHRKISTHRVYQSDYTSFLKPNSESMATKTLIRTGASLLNRFVSKTPLLHQPNTIQNPHLFPSLSKIQTSLHLPPQNNAFSLSKLSSQDFLHPYGLPSVEFFLPNGTLSHPPLFCTFIMYLFISWCSVLNLF